MALDIDQQKVVRMYNDDQLTIREIADRLGASYGVIQQIVSTHTSPRPSGYQTKGGEPPSCGTKRGYQRHIDRGEEPDDLCKQANRDYTNEYNRRTGTSRARNRAYRRLARTFPHVFDALLEEEKLKLQEEKGRA